MGKTAGVNGTKKAPVYSADAMAVRYLFGILLIAAGIVVVLAAVVRLKGSMFDAVRTVCFGSMGALAVVLPVFFIWAGVLAIYSAQRRSPVRPWLFALLGFIILSAFLILVTRYGEQPYLDYLKTASSGQWGDIIGRSYFESAKKGLSGRMMPGGAVGCAVAWPLHLYCGDFLGCLILGVLIILCLLAAFRTSPAGLVRMIRGRRGQSSSEQAEEEQRRLAWQREQELRAKQHETYPGERQPGPPNVRPTGMPNRQPVMPDMRSGNIPNGAQGQFAGNGEGPRLYYGEPAADSTDKALRGAAGAGGAVDGRGFPTQENDMWEWHIAEKQTQSPAPDRKAQTDDSLFTDQKMSRTGKSRAFGRPDKNDGVSGAARPVPELRTSLRPVLKAKPLTEIQAAQPDASSGGQSASETAAKRTRRNDKEGTRVNKEPSAARGKRNREDDGSRAYTPPPMEDLSYPKNQEEDTAAEDAMRSRRLEETLVSFRVQAKVVHVTHGPAISRFELELATGIKVGKVAELEKDIAYGMEAASVRIEAPIPGKSLVGVEVPNRRVAVVTLREVLDSPPMRQSKSILTVALGKDIAGTPVVCDLSRMPHMLIAGATGSGKSVCINVIINSLLYRASPEEVRLILVDPKVVELQCYQDIPHLLIPVVNDPRKAASALAWAVAEMMERYDRFAERRVRNLEGYNAVLAPGEKPMYRIVIIIDELSDLMMACKKDVESYIVRLTQLARAAGIHLIVATQRPSVDVITGLIKANIPSRIAFKTASSVDSRTIIDRNGAEQLLGWGDMLYAPTGSFSPVRIQGCYLSDDEVNSIVAHVRASNPNDYDPNILEKVEELNRAQEKTDMSVVGGPPENDDGDRALLEQCVEYALADGQISTSTLQRRLKIGYARAGRLTDMMEERGFISAKDGSKPRKCIITREEWEKIKRESEGSEQE